MNEDEIMDDLDYIEEHEEDIATATPEGEPDGADGSSTLQEEGASEGDYLSRLLQSRGISDSSKIKFENENGEVEDRSWDDLSDDEKFNILNQQDAPETGLDDSEIQLINAIRNSGLSTQDYVNYIQQYAVNQYMQNAQEPQYSVDQYTNDELFVADLKGRLGDSISDEELLNELEAAKQNPTLFDKKMDAIRKEYQRIEQDNLQQLQMQQEYEAQQQYNQFTNNIADQIQDFTEFLGYDIDLTQDDVNELYEFITGVDAAGNNHFAKALTDPKTLVQTAWLALNGRQMLDDITEYYNNEITKVRKESYKKGVEDANSKNQKKSDTVYKKKTTASKQQVADWDDDDF